MERNVEISDVNNQEIINKLKILEKFFRDCVVFENIEFIKNIDIDSLSECEVKKIFERIIINSELN